MHRPLPLAFAVLALLPSSLLRAAESGSCVQSTCTCPDGRTVTGACDQDCAAVCGVSASGAPARGAAGLTPMQNMELQGAYGVGQAIGSAFTNWLLSPGSGDRGEQAHQQSLRQQQVLSYEQTLKRQQEEARVQAERRDREAAKIRFRRQHDSLMAHLKDEPEKTLAPKDPDTEQTLTGLKSQVRAMNCAMAEVYDAAGAIGPEGAAINADLRRQLLGIYKELPTLDLGASRPFSIDHMDSGRKGDAQFVLQGRLQRDEATGRTTIDVNYSFSKNGKEKRAGQSFVVLDTLGDIECQHVTGAAARCLSQFNPAWSAKEYCPRPGPIPKEKNGDAIKSGGLELKDE